MWVDILTYNWYVIQWIQPNEQENKYDTTTNGIKLRTIDK